MHPRVPLRASYHLAAAHVRGRPVLISSGNEGRVVMWDALTGQPLAEETAGTVLVGLALINAGDFVGLGRWWAKTPMVRSLPWLR